MSEWLGLPTAASPQATDVVRLIAHLHWFMLVVFAGWIAYFAYVLVRFRRAQSRPRTTTGVPTRVAVLLVGIVTTWELVELAGFALPAWNRRFEAMSEPARATAVRVVAEQFNWNVHYPGPDGAFGRTRAELITPDNPLGLDRSDASAVDDVTTINELNLPVDVPVMVELTAKDVVHSFTLPEMGIKQDAIPGTIVIVSFLPTRPSPEDTGWEISCSQLCGLGHYRMRGTYRILSGTAFEAWFEEERALQNP